MIAANKDVNEALETDGDSSCLALVALRQPSPEGYLMHYDYWYYLVVLETSNNIGPLGISRFFVV